MRKRIRKSKEGILFKSPYSGHNYRVYKWKDLGDGKIIAIEKRREHD